LAQLATVNTNHMKALHGRVNNDVWKPQAARVQVYGMQRIQVEQSAVSQLHL